MMNLARHIWVGVCDPSPLGKVWVAVSPTGLAAVQIGGERDDFVEHNFNNTSVDFYEDGQITAKYVRQISDYLVGKLQDFTLNIDWGDMRSFQVSVLHQTLLIPYGKTTTYKALAEKVGKPKAARAVGQAQARNPIPLVIPCHRVVGSDGELHGYGGSGGIQTKAWLLALEKKYMNE